MGIKISHSVHHRKSQHDRGMIVNIFKSLLNEQLLQKRIQCCAFGRGSFKYLLPCGGKISPKQTSQLQKRVLQADVLEKKRVVWQNWSSFCSQFTAIHAWKSVFRFETETLHLPLQTSGQGLKCLSLIRAVVSSIAQLTEISEQKRTPHTHSVSLEMLIVRVPLAQQEERTELPRSQS